MTSLLIFISILFSILLILFFIMRKKHTNQIKHISKELKEISKILNEKEME